jgi:hypothetical protein
MPKPIVLKFFDWSVPPEEEVLAAKLILEHREPWLRNEATLFHELQNWYAEPVFKNPFGDKSDGTSDAAFMTGIGLAFKAMDPAPPKKSLQDVVDEVAFDLNFAPPVKERQYLAHICQIPEGV